MIPGSLLAGPYPAGPDTESTTAILGALLDAGIESVINLTDDDEGAAAEEELSHLVAYEDELEALGEKRGLVVEIERFPIEPRTAPTPAAMQLVIDAIDGEIDGRNSPTLVHCLNGNGRVGMVIGCYLARHGIATGAEAIARLNELRAANPDLAGLKCPETIVQERFVTRWKNDQ
ncbi:MAG: hypothetical protein ACE5E4_10085 [Candidatus Binatia bacterium]